ncbi:MAG: UPF0489 family protein [Gemmatimonadaceae bacterium]
MRMMRVLDLDLDFFLDAIATGPAPDGARRDGALYQPRSAEFVATFLERRCGLRDSRAADGPRRPIGRTVETHDGAFYFWRELIDGGELTTPFDVVHVDAHADLGLGDTGYRYIMCELLHLPALDRASPNPAWVMEGNYLTFAAACRWLESVTYVKHPARQHDDRPFEHFLRNDADSGFLQLKACDALRFATDAAHGAIASSVVALEPAIPFLTVESDAFLASAPFDVVVLARSPLYTPASADALLPVIEAYFDAR